MMVVTDWPIFLQVNLTKCTKEVDADLQALCPQNVETNEKPLAVYLKNLCCDTCNFQESGKVNRLAIYLGSILGALLVIVLVSIIAVLAYKNRAIRASLREIQEGNFCFCLHFSTAFFFASTSVLGVQRSDEFWEKIRSKEI